MNGRRSWSRRQIAVGVLVLAIFVVVAAVLPVLIAPGGPARPAATTPVTTAPTAPASPTSPSPSPSSQPFELSRPVRARPVEDPPDRTYREFQSVCALQRRTSRPPVAGLYPGGATSYDVFGSTGTTLPAPQRVPGGSTSCLNAADRSTYWLPVLYQGGRVVEPERFTVLYKGTVDDYTAVQAFPPGLRILAGGASAPASPAQGAVSWSCTGYDEPRLPSACPAGDRLTLRLSAPGCWDGRHLDVPGHRRHLAWPIDGRCPADHPVAVPALLVDVVYPLEAAGALRTVSGRGEDFGFGFVSGWRTTALSRLVGTCINAGRQCDAQGRPS